MNIPERDGDGYLTDMNAWTEDVGRAMAEADGYELDEAKWDQIMKARAYFEEFSSVPPIRKFAKYLNEDQNAVFKLWMTGPMKPITKYGGLPQAPLAASEALVQASPSSAVPPKLRWAPGGAVVGLLT
jgi:TusE/DsrC/DsvC family sulfur relay protein